MRRFVLVVVALAVPAGLVGAYFALRPTPDPVGDRALTLSEVKVSPGLNQDDVAQALQDHPWDLDACYRATASDEPPSGAFLLTLDLDATGRVTHAAAVGAFSEELRDCVVRAAEHWVLPTPAGPMPWARATFALQSGVMARARIVYPTHGKPLVPGR